jgi:uncharacterized protein with von Willebrand factor type A (vWA) domain
VTARHHLLRAAARARGQRTGEPAHDVVVFARLLRQIDVAVAPTASLTAVRALGCVRLDRRDDVRAALACSLTASVQDRAVFDVVFDTFWSEVDTDIADVGGPGGSGESTGQSGTDPEQLGGRLSQSPARRHPDQGMIARRAVYSREPGQSGTVALARASDIDAVARRLARALGGSPGRRFATGERGEAVDVRASMRANLRFGEELLVLRRTARRRDRARIVVLCDISSSMRPYTPLFLAFVHALTRLVRGVEAAVFNVELLMVTDVFRRSDRRRALAWLGRQDAALAGGTRIGHCLVRFLDEVERGTVLRSDTVAVILSDGWDVGEPELLESGMRRLRELAQRVIWCDPHAVTTDYRPQVQGMRVALPYCDHYLDFGSVASLTELVSTVTRKDRR